MYGSCHFMYGLSAALLKLQLESTRVKMCVFWNQNAKSRILLGTVYTLYKLKTCEKQARYPRPRRRAADIGLDC